MNFYGFNSKLLDNRLSAKSKEKFIITKSGNQIKSKREAFSAIAIPLRKDLKTFNKRDRVFNIDSKARNFTIT